MSLNDLVLLYEVFIWLMLYLMEYVLSIYNRYSGVYKKISMTI